MGLLQVFLRADHKNSIHVLTSLILLSPSFQLLLAAPRNEALIVGGACEGTNSSMRTTDVPPKWTQFGDTTGSMAGYTNLFRQKFIIANAALEKNGWVVDHRYGNERWEKLRPDGKIFDSKEFLKNLSDKVQTLNAGDQFFLGITTHGSEPPHHAICAGDRMISITELAPALSALRMKGVKVAVLDDSCFAGGTVDELKGVGVCTMSGTNTNTTGSGAAQIWNGIFGLGFRSGTDLSQLGYKTIPSGTADVNGDDRISAAEAFQFARLHSHEDLFPQTSDCLFRFSNLRTLINGASELLDQNGYQLAITHYWNNRAEAPTHGALCALKQIPEEFEKIFQLADSVQLAWVAKSMTVLGYSDGFDFVSKLDFVRKASAALEQLASDAKADRDAADRAIANGQGVPSDMKSRLRKIDLQATPLKEGIMKRLRPLIHMACKLEKIHTPKIERPCEDFKLFPKRGPSS